MKTAVTGGSGLVGKYVCDELSKAGHEVVSLDIVAPEDDTRFIQVDLTDLKAACEAIDGFETVVHLAAIPNPFHDAPEKVMGVNMMTAFNVFEAARKTGAGRVVYGCSESSTGFGIHERPIKPLYVPIDEQHPCWPHETYSLSKHLGERIGANYARVYGLEVVSLRYTWVWTRLVKEAAAKVVADARAGRFSPDDAWLGAYIAVRDVARACAASCEFTFGSQSPPFEAFFLTAKNTFYPVGTLEVLTAIYEDSPAIRDRAYFDDNPHASVFDIRKAERLLGWTPQCDWRNFDDWEF